MILKFRDAEQKDWYKIKQIAYATWPDTFGAMLPAIQIKTMLAVIYKKESLMRQVKEGHKFLLAEQAGEAVGFCSYEPNYKAMQHLMIHKLYLLPTVQGLGIGTKILNWISGTARLHHDVALRLKVFYLNQKAINFYIKYGFKKTNTEITKFDNNYNIIDYVLIKKL